MRELAGCSRMKGISSVASMRQRIMHRLTIEFLRSRANAHGVRAAKPPSKFRSTLPGVWTDMATFCLTRLNA